MRKSTGQKDPAMALLKRLMTDDGRRRESLFMVEGAELTRRALDMPGEPVVHMILCDSFAQSAEGQCLCESAAAKGVEVVTAATGLIAKILGAKPTPECIGVVHRKLTALKDVLASSPAPLIQMVEHCENADNLGMLLRSTEAAGVDGVILTADTIDPFNRRTVRGSRGAVFNLPLCITSDPLGAIASAREYGLQIVGTSANAKASYLEQDYTRPTIVLAGNEHTGLSRDIKNACDALVAIPMMGKIHSLNIAASATVMLYEALRQRRRISSNSANCPV